MLPVRNQRSNEQVLYYARLNVLGDFFYSRGIDNPKTIHVLESVGFLLFVTFKEKNRVTEINMAPHKAFPKLYPEYLNA